MNKYTDHHKAALCLPKKAGRVFNSISAAFKQVWKKFY